MARQNITTTHPLTWEKVQGEFDKVNDNFTELYGGVISTSLIPDADVTYDLGSPTNRFKDLYLSGSTINLGGAVISANPDGSVNVPGGLETGFSLVGFAQENSGVSANGKTITISSPINPGWTLGVHIVTQADYLYPSQVRPQCSFTEDGSGNITSVTVISPGVNYPAREYGGVFENQGGELTTDLGFTRFGPDDGEPLTITGVGNTFGYQLSSLNHLYTYSEFVVDEQSQTVTGTATAQGTFNGILYELTFGLKFRDMNDPGYEYGLIVDPLVSSITIGGLSTATAGEIRQAFTGGIIYLQTDNQGDWSLTLESGGLSNQTDFSIIFDKALELGQDFYPLWAPQTSVQAIGDSSVSGNLTVSGTVTLAETLILTPGAEPSSPTEGSLAVADGVNWDPAGDGSKQMVLFLNGVWNLVSLTALP